MNGPGTITNNRQRVWGLFFPTMWRKVIANIAIVLSAALHAPRCSAQIFHSDAFIQAIGTMKHSVAAIICPVSTSAGTFNPVVDGTAFFVSAKGDFITADHVLQDFDAGHPFAGCTGQIGFSKPTTPGHFDYTLYSFNIGACARDAGIDIAICHTGANLKTANDGDFRPDSVAIASEQMDDGSAVAFTGFPLGTPIPVSARGYVAGYQLDARGPVTVIIDRAAWPGASGSPVFDYRGRVIGMMIVAGENRASGISYARSGYALAQFLSAHPLPAD